MMLLVADEHRKELLELFTTSTVQCDTFNSEHTLTVIALGIAMHGFKCCCSRSRNIYIHNMQHQQHLTIRGTIQRRTF